MKMELHYKRERREALNKVWGLIFSPVRNDDTDVELSRLLDKIK